MMEVKPCDISAGTLLNLVNAVKAMERSRTVTRRNYWVNRVCARIRAYEAEEQVLKECFEEIRQEV